MPEISIGVGRGSRRQKKYNQIWDRLSNFLINKKINSIHYIFGLPKSQLLCKIGWYQKIIFLGKLRKTYLSGKPQGVNYIAYDCPEEPHFSA